MKLSMSEILDKTEKLSDKKEKLDFLRLHHSKQFHWVLNCAFHPGIVFDLPETNPPYKPLETNEAQGMLYKQARTMYLFCKGGRELPKHQKEHLFIQLLESIDPNDAKLVLNVKNKNLPYKTITQELIEEAYGNIDPFSNKVFCPCKDNKGGL